MAKKHRIIIHDIGILLGLFGIPLASVINEYTARQYDMSSFFLAVSIIFMIDWKRLFYFQFRIKTDLFFIFLFLIYNIVIEIIAGQNMTDQARGMIYTIFAIVLLVSAATQKRITDPLTFLRIAWIILGVFNVLLLYLLSDHFTRFTLVGGSTLSYGADRLTLSKLAYGYLIVELIFLRKKGYKNKLELIASLLLFAVSIINALYCHRRSSIIYYAIILLLHFLYYDSYGISQKTRKSLERLFKGTIILVCVILIIWQAYPNVINRFADNFNSMTLAINTILGRGANDVSASTRNTLRTDAIITLRESNILELIIGHGYMYEYLDFPLLQAILDMGFFGLFYIIIQCILPLRYLRVKHTNAAERFFQYIAILFFFDNIFAGIPYGYGKYAPLIFLFLQVSYRNRTNTNIDECLIKL